MRILLDECLPARFRRELPGHGIQTVPQAGWAGIKNGRLLRLIAGSGKFDVFLTVNKIFRASRKSAACRLPLWFCAPNQITSQMCAHSRRKSSVDWPNSNPATLMSLRFDGFPTHK